MARGRIGQIVDSITNPIRRNDFEARRRRLGLSRNKLARILDVDPSTVFRHERGPMVVLWDYALRGIEAEAASGKKDLRSYTAGLDHQVFIPNQLNSRG